MSLANDLACQFSCLEKGNVTYKMPASLGYSKGCQIKYTQSTWHSTLSQQLFRTMLQMLLEVPGLPWHCGKHH
jgi:hypothetical protein